MIPPSSPAVCSADWREREARVTYGRPLPAGDSRPTRHPTRLACQATALVGCAGSACRTRSGHRDRAASCRRSGPHRHHADRAVVVSGGGGGELNPGKIHSMNPGSVKPCLHHHFASAPAIRLGRHFRRSIPPATVAQVTRRDQVNDRLPPLPSPDATDAERGKAIMARLVARIGAPTLEDYRRAYAGCGAPWPGDDEIRRRHPVAADSAA
jgi:hypothetical protein